MRPSHIAPPLFRRIIGGSALDLAFSLRGLRRRPAFALTAVATIALAVGATTSTFSVVDAVLLRALPFANAERLVALLPGQSVANRDLDLLRSRLTSLDEVAVFSPGWLMPLIDVAEPRQLNAARVSGNMFAMVGVRPHLGRTFGMEAETAAEGGVAVLAFDLWQQVFRGDSGVVGRSVALDGGRYTVIGVMPRGFQLFDWQSDVWVPMTMGRDEFTWTGATSMAYGRLRAGRTLADARAELRSVVPAIAAEFGYARDWGAGADLVGMRESLVGDVRRMLWLLFGAVVFLLCIATGNVANLLLVRASERRSELALRTSLGASMGRIARLLLGESLILGVAGGSLGVALALASVRNLPALLPPDLPRLGEVAVNGRMLAFALVATLLPSLAVGLAPVLQTWRSGLASALRESRAGAVRGTRLRGGLVALQVALSMGLLVGASIMGRSLVSLLRVDRGLRSDHLLTATVMPVGRGDPEALRVFWRETLGRIEALPGVTGAATILHLPTAGRSWHADIDVAGRPTPPGQPKPRAAWQVVSTRYFEVAGVPILAGRPFGATDRASSPRVVAVNAAFATRHFPRVSPIGEVITAGHATNDEPATIVAVVGGVRHDSLSAPPPPELYVPMEQTTVSATSLVVRTTVHPRAIASVVRGRVWSVDPRVPVTAMRSMDELFSASLARPRLILTILSSFAAAGMVLGAVGMYGVVAYGVQQRARELGIRAALGADTRALRALVVRGGVRFASVGVLAGVPLALALGWALRGMVFGISTADPVTFLLVPALLLAVAGVASWLPARRAASADPMAVLREE